MDNPGPFLRADLKCAQGHNATANVVAAMSSAAAG